MREHDGDVRPLVAFDKLLVGERRSVDTLQFILTPIELERESLGQVQRVPAERLKLCRRNLRLFLIETLSALLT